MKRVDWDPQGERNTRNRGVSKYERITWDEATTLIAAEIKRVHDEYGPSAILCQADGHGETKVVHAPHGCQAMMLDAVRRLHAAGAPARQLGGLVLGAPSTRGAWTQSACR